MVRDYRERKQVSKNRPKTRPVGLMVFSLIGVAGVSFALGILVDRFVLRPREHKAVVPAAAPQAAAAAKPSEQHQKPSEPPTAAAPPNGAKPTGDPALTFYETLPKGGKGILGSGINPKHPEIKNAAPKAAPPAPEASAVREQAPQPAEAKPQPAPAPSSKAPEQHEKKSVTPVRQEKEKVSPAATKEPGADKKANSSKSKYSVQVASAKSRSEADAIKAKLQESGYAAYIVESPVPGKGTWYRVRVGRQMDQAAAGRLVSQLGKGAILIPEQ